MFRISLLDITESKKICTAGAYLFSTGAMGALKVSKNRNDFMKTSFLPKSNAIILRISALTLTGQKSLKKLR
jgi:hypothetical protein